MIAPSDFSKKSYLLDNLREQVAEDGEWIEDQKADDRDKVFVWKWRETDISLFEQKLAQLGILLTK
jgi:hypothetical protein